MFPRFVSAPSTRAAALALALLPFAPCAAGAQAARPSIQFNGTVDADFITSFNGGGFADPVHTTGLEIDLTTTVTFSPRLNAVIATTMNDGIVPGQGAGRTWDDVNFDGAQLNWQYSDKTRITVGDITQGVGYFNYYFYKRTAVAIGEHTLRGAGLTRGGFTVASGATDLGRLDSAGAGIPTRAWATFARYDLDLGAGGVLTPSLKYTAGIPGSTLVNAGLSYDAKFGAVTLSTDLAVNADPMAGTDPGFAILVEPAYAAGRFSLASTVFYKKSGSVPSANALTSTLPADAGEDSKLPPKPLDDLVVYLEPGLTLSNTYSVGLPLEYHDATSAADDESVAVVPTFYVYPGSGVQWWLWAGVSVPTAGGADPAYTAGSEIIFKF
jgi:hypothetical protein